MPELDLALTGGRLVFPDEGVRSGDIGVRDGRIAVICEPGGLGPAARTVSCGDRFVMPGLIDPHNHVGFGDPDQDFLTETRSAALGGVTTLLNFFRTKAFADGFPLERAKAERLAAIDFGFHFGLTSWSHIENLAADAARFGVTSFKLYLMYKGAAGAARGFTEIDDGLLFGALQAVARIKGGVLGVHCENIEVVPYLRKGLQAAGRDDLAAWDEQSPDFLEAENVHRVCYFGRKTGCPVNIVHLSSAEGLSEARRHKGHAGARISIETCPHYLFLTRDSRAAALAKVNPAVRTDADREALWEGLRDGTVTTIGSDHVPRKRATKEGGIWKASAGFPGLATSLPIMMDEGFHRRRIPIERIAAVTSLNVARLYGLHAKGRLAVGADADIVVVDPDRTRAVAPDELESHSDYSPYEGETLKGWPVLTVLRGRVLAEEGRLAEAALAGRSGRYVARSGRPADSPASHGTAGMVPDSGD